VPTKRDELLRFGRTVRDLREAKGLSQEEFADRIAIHRTYIGGIERGERNPTLLTIQKIATALGIPAWKLLHAMDHKA
jgi:transcriptional regulator with XRE-family HTH domain